MERQRACRERGAGDSGLSGGQLTHSPTPTAVSHLQPVHGAQPAVLAGTRRPGTTVGRVPKCWNKKQACDDSAQRPGSKQSEGPGRVMFSTGDEETREEFEA